MKRPYSLQAKDVTLNFVKDKYGPNERQDLGKLISIWKVKNYHVMIIRVHIFLGNFYFDLEADLTELFHWNNKQLFIYIMGKGPLSTVYHFLFVPLHLNDSWFHHKSRCCTIWIVKDLSKAEYKTDQNDINQVIVWDRIIKRGEKTKLNLKRKVKNLGSKLISEFYKSFVT